MDLSGFEVSLVDIARPVPGKSTLLGPSRKVPCRTEQRCPIYLPNWCCRVTTLSSKAQVCKSAHSNHEHNRRGRQRRWLTLLAEKAPQICLSSYLKMMGPHHYLQERQNYIFRHGHERDSGKWAESLRSWKALEDPSQKSMYFLC